MTALRHVPVLALTLICFFFSIAVAIPPAYIPLLPPAFGDPCIGVDCGQGNCTVSSNSTYGYECTCDEGWRQDRYEDYGFLNFLPCAVPNCTLNYTCGNIPFPELDRPNVANLSIFDSCFWTDCGGGICNQTSPFTHTCDCAEGFYNLFNSTIFPCLRECSILTGCPALGYNLTNITFSSTPYPTFENPGEENHATNLILRTQFTHLLATVATLVMVVCYYI